MSHVIIDHTLSGDVRFGLNDVLEFRDGAMVTNGTIHFSHNKIIGRGQLFSGIYSVSGSLDEYALRAEWFGLKEYGPTSNPQETVFDNTVSINTAISFCIITGVRNLIFNTGFYYVGGTINIGENRSDCEDESKFWDINLIGAGNNYPDIDNIFPISGESYSLTEGVYGRPRGTAFLMGENARFYVNMKNPLSDVSRGGSISYCSFYGIGVELTSTNYIDIVSGKAIEIDCSQCFEIKHCNFVRLKTAIILSDHTYYTHIDACNFDYCERGIISGEGEGDANDNMVSNCMFKRCNYPITISDNSKGWHIYDCDFEGNNGTCYIGNENRITNVRIERNKDDVVWLHCKSGCIISADIHGLGQTLQEWKCLVEGDCNQINLHFTTYTPFGVISYGRGNYFNIITQQASDNTYGATMIICDPEDTLVVNGYLNKEDCFGDNLITGDNFLFLQDESYKKNWQSGHTKPLSPFLQCQNVYITSPGDTQELYATCNFYIEKNSSVTDVSLFGYLFTMQKEHNKWFTLVMAAKKEHNIENINNTIEVYRAISNDRIHIINVVVATKMLFSRPVMKYSEPTAYQVDKQGVIHLRTPHDDVVFQHMTYLNYITSCFSYQKDSFQKYYVDIFDKTIYRKNNKYYCNGHELGAYCGCLMPIVNSNLEYVLNGLLKAELLVNDFQNGDVLKLLLYRSSLTDGFESSLLASTGPQMIANNALGTVAVSGFSNNRVLVWVEILP